MQKQVPRIRPSQKPKKRYVLFSLQGEKGLSFRELSEQFWIAIVQKIGKQEALLLGFQLIVFDFGARKGIFRCRREKCKMAIQVFSSIRKILGSRVLVKTLKTSGTIKALKECLEPKSQVF